MVRKDRIVSAAPGIPRIESEARVKRVVVVAEVETSVLDEAGVEDRVQAQHRARAVAPARVKPQGTAEIDRRKRQAAIFERIVPVAVNENVAARRPDVA